MENNFSAISKQRRTTRRFTSTSIPEEIVERILKTTLTEPTGFGGSPVEFVVVRDKAMLQAIAHCKRIGASPLEEASVGIVVIADTADELWWEDASIAASYILLAAEENGVGACWNHIRNRSGQRKTSDEEIRQLLGIPSSFSVLCVIALGEKKEVKPPHRDEELHYENIHYGTYS